MKNKEIQISEIWNDEKKSSLKEFITTHSQKQETLEEAAERIISDMGWIWENTESSARMVARHCAKWQQERSYSEEEVIAFGEFIFKHSLLTHAKGVKNLFEQFKNK